MQIDWGKIISSVITNTASAVSISVVLAVLGYLGKSLIEQWSSRNLEKYKSDLQAANERDLEKYKSDLQTTNERELERLRVNLKLAGFEYEIRFAELHKRQAEVIAKFYALLVIVEEKIQWMGSILVGDDESELTLQAISEKRAEDARKELNDLIDFYQKNRLYFRESTCSDINVLIEDLQETFRNFKAATLKEKIDKERWWTAQIAVAEKIPETRLLVEKDFREILGYKSEDQA